MACKTTITQSPLIFDESFVGSSNPPVLDLPSIVQMGGSGSLVVPGLELNEFANLVPNQIRLKILWGSSNSFFGVVSIGFDREKSVHSLKTATTSVLLLTDPTSPSNSKLLTGCNGAGWIPVEYDQSINGAHTE